VPWAGPLGYSEVTGIGYSIIKTKMNQLARFTSVFLLMNPKWNNFQCLEACSERSVEAQSMEGC
jgi:hypothetical protein